LISPVLNQSKKVFAKLTMRPNLEWRPAFVSLAGNTETEHGFFQRGTGTLSARLGRTITTAFFIC